MCTGYAQRHAYCAAMPTVLPRLPCCHAYCAAMPTYPAASYMQWCLHNLGTYAI